MGTLIERIQAISVDEKGRHTKTPFMPLLCSLKREPLSAGHLLREASDGPYSICKVHSKRLAADVTPRYVGLPQIDHGQRMRTYKWLPLSEAAPVGGAASTQDVYVSSSWTHPNPGRPYTNINLISVLTNARSGR